MEDRNRPEPVLLMERISKSFGATRALDNVGLRLARAEVLALIGENGAGKSTLVKVLSGALLPDAGRMTIEGRPYRPASPLDGIRHGISIVYQELTLAPHLSVEENIVLGREPSSRGWLNRRARRDLVRGVLETVNHPEIRPDARVSSLGMGARQVVEIARALANEAKILVLDEPTSSLNEEDARRLFELIRRLKARGVSVIYISHFLEEVMQVADCFAVLRDGRNAGSGRIGEAGIDDLVQMMIGQKMTDMFPRVPHEPGETLLEVKSLAGGAMSSPVSLSLARGEILGVAGLVGSGRTEFLRTLFGLDEVAGGLVVLNGRDLTRGRPWTRIEDGFGLLSEDRQGEGLAVSQSIADNIALSDFSPYRRFGFLRTARQAGAVADLLGALNIKASGPWQRVRELSGGNQQKVAMARLMHQDASILLLDEPTRGIDVVSKAQVYAWVGEMAARGKSVIFVSSYFPELLGIADRIVVFHRGRPVEERPARAWDMPSLMAAATTGRPAAAHAASGCNEGESHGNRTERKA
jgi:ribose transport system ATP-binding protein